MAEVRIRVVLRSLPETPATEGPLDVGLQDKAGAVAPGRDDPAGGLVFAADLGVVDKAGTLDFRGPYVHGRPGARFVYLGWKRRGAEGPPWFQRVKIPLGDLAPDLVRRAQDGGGALEADVTGRRPHEIAPIAWTLAPA